MRAEAQCADIILDLIGVSKFFGAVHALNSVSFSVKRGEVHAILGENGAGKSTLLKIINGEYPLDEGEIRLSGKPITISERGGGDIAMVHQELVVFENMTVAENIFVEAMPLVAGGRIDFKAMHTSVGALLSLFGMDVDPREKLAYLTPGQQQVVEILRAVQSKASLLILDEPTSGLNSREAKTLLALIKRLRGEGHTILYVSHRLHEILDIADRITVLRDGEFIDTLENNDLTEDDLIRRMVGRSLDMDVTRQGYHSNADTPLALQINGLSMTGSFDGIDLSVRRGEILGVFGLEGAGTEELSKAIFGLSGTTSGTITLGEIEVTDAAPATRMRMGMAYLNGNRKEAGLYMERSVADNISAPILNTMTRAGLVVTSRIEETAHQAVRRYAIGVSDISDQPNQLSGGNQQKVMFSACLANNPDVIILNEPTRGVDVGAKAEVHNEIRNQADTGKAVIVFSSDMPEVLRLSDRIAVMCARQLAGQLDGPAIGEKQVMALAAGIT